MSSFPIVQVPAAALVSSYVRIYNVYTSNCNIHRANPSSCTVGMLQTARSKIWLADDTTMYRETVSEIRDEQSECTCMKLRLN